VTKEADLERAFAAVVERFGRIDVLIKNSGFAIRSRALDISVKDWNTVLAVDLTGTFLGARIAARPIVASGNNWANVNTASIMGCRVALIRTSLTSPRKAEWST